MDVRIYQENRRIIEIRKGKWKYNGKKWLAQRGGEGVFMLNEDKKMHLCINYKDLHKVDTTNTYPLPWMEDLMNCFRDATYFTKLDLWTSYDQIQIRGKDQVSHKIWAFRVLGIALWTH